MNIKVAQNQEWAVKGIAASSVLYSQAKFLNNLYAALNVFLITALTFLSIFLNGDVLPDFLGIEKVDLSSWVAAVSIIVLAVNSTVLDSGLDGKRELAAKIQEQVDRRLYGLDWNSTLAGSPPLLEVVNKYSRKYLSKSGGERFKDWYSLDSDKVGRLHQALICQNSCLAWD